MIWRVCWSMAIQTHCFLVFCFTRLRISSASTSRRPMVASLPPPAPGVPPPAVDPTRPAHRRQRCRPWRASLSPAPGASPAPETTIGAPGSMRDTTTEAHAQRLGGGERRSPSLSGVHATSSLRRPRESRLRPRSPQLPVSQPPLHPCGMKPTVLTAHLRRHYTRIQALSGKASVRERRFPCMTNVLKAGPGGRSSVG
jgi:hypothetical protein